MQTSQSHSNAIKTKTGMRFFFGLKLVQKRKLAIVNEYHQYFNPVMQRGIECVENNAGAMHAEKIGLKRGRSPLGSLVSFVNRLRRSAFQFAIVFLLLLCLPKTMTNGLFYFPFRLVFGTLYPAYASYKAVRTKNVKEYVSTAFVFTHSTVTAQLRGRS